MSEPRIMFVSRAYPPVVGGIEKQNYELCNFLSRRLPVVAVVNRRGKSFLPIFLPLALFRMFRQRREYDVVLFGDGVLAVLAFVLKLFSKTRTACVVHGLDVTYANPVYRALWVRRFFGSVDRFLAVSSQTATMVAEAGVDPEKIQVIPNGIERIAIPAAYGRSDLAALLGSESPGPVLLCLGRLVRRKGFAWFVREVMPLLPSHVTLVIAGSGVDEPNVRAAIETSGSGSRIRYLGEVDARAKEMLLSSCDLFVQPNIPVPGDMEGFGIVVLEAAMAGTFVVASALEGLMDSVHQGKNGVLVEPLDAQKFADVIVDLLSDPGKLKVLGEDARNYVMVTFGWDAVGEKYVQALRTI